MRNQSIDSVKLMFAFTVVIMHGFLLDSENTGYISGLLRNGFFITAVPFFFIVSGYLFFKTIKKNHTKKWYIHIIKIYAIWSIIYAYTLIPIFNLPDASLVRKIYLVCRAEITGVVHLWFIPALIIASSLCFIFKEHIQRKTKITLYIISMLWLFGVALDWYFMSINSQNTFLYKNGIFYGAPMFILGFIISSNEQEITKKKIDFKSLMIISVAILIIESIISTKLINAFKDHIYQSLDMMISTPLLSTLIFIICLKKPALRILNGSERLTSTFMYYCHILFLDISILLITASGWHSNGLFKDIVATIMAIMLVFIVCFNLKNKVAKVI